jgi:hypothetical protein
MGKNILEPAIWRMRIACWVPEATNTHTEYVILLFHSSSYCTNAPLRNVQVVPLLLLSSVLLCIIRPIIHEYFFYLVLERVALSHRKPTLAETSNDTSSAQISDKRDSK